MTNQPQLPSMPWDFSEPVECRGRDLASVIAEARAAGYHAHRMTVLPEVNYRLCFWKQAAQDARTAIFIRGEGEDSGRFLIKSSQPG